MIEAMLLRTAGPQVPFADKRGGVAGGTEDARHRDEVPGQLVLRPHDVGDAEASRHLTRQQGSAGRTTDRISVKALELDAFLHEAVEVWGRGRPVVKRDIAPAEIIG